jgi:hypothetical protein
LVCSLAVAAAAVPGAVPAACLAARLLQFLWLAEARFPALLWHVISSLSLSASILYSSNTPVTSHPHQASSTCQAQSWAGPRWWPPGWRHAASGRQRPCAPASTSMWRRRWTTSGGCWVVLKLGLVGWWVLASGLVGAGVAGWVLVAWWVLEAWWFGCCLRCFSLVCAGQGLVAAAVSCVWGRPAAWSDRKGRGGWQLVVASSWLVSTARCLLSCLLAPSTSPFCSNPPSHHPSLHAPLASSALQHTDWSCAQ